MKAAIEFQPTTILLDIGLPEMNGFEVARRLRQEPALKNVRIIALTGYGQEADRQQCHEAGFDAHLIKPVTLQRILEVLAAPAMDRTSGARRIGRRATSSTDGCHPIWPISAQFRRGEITRWRSNSGPQNQAARW